MKYSYRFGPEPIAAAGYMRAFGNRILVRAILDTDWYALENPDYSTRLSIVSFNAVDAVAFEVVSVGAGVQKTCEAMGEVPPEPGQHCDIRSVAADRVYSKDPSGRFWLVPVEDVAGVWDPVETDAPGIEDACRIVIARAMEQRSQVNSTGEAELSPG